MTNLRRQILLLIVLQVCMYGEASTKEEFENNFQSLFNFMNELRITSGTLRNFFTKIQATFCPEQPICSSKGIQDRDSVLSTLPRYLDIGTSSIRVENISDIVGMCCLPCSCSDTCFVHGYCCLSKFFNRSVTEQGRSDIASLSALKRNEDAGLVGDISDTSLTNISDTVNFNDTPGWSECVRSSLNSFSRADTVSTELGYFMITSCLDKTTYKNLRRKCEEPSIDVFDETVPVTSRRTNQTYWNQYCALCNEDGHDTIHWSSIGDFGTELLFFANSSYVPAFPKTFDELYRKIIYRDGIIHSPPFPMANKRCLLRLHECEEKSFFGEKNVRDIPWLVELCRQYTSPIEKKQFFTNTQYRMQPFRNIFCFFCRENETGLLQNSRCSLNLEASRIPSSKLIGLINYKPKADPKSSADARLALENGHCLFREVYENNLDLCRPVLCPPGDFMDGCQCVQLVKNLSGMPILIFVKVVPGSGKLPTMTSNQIQRYSKTLSRTLQNAVDDITVELVATFKQNTENGPNLLSVVIIRSYQDHDTKQTLKPFLTYLDSNREMEMLIGKYVYFVRLTSRIRMWGEWNKSSLTTKTRLLDFDVKEQDPPLIQSDLLTLRQVYAQSAYQVFSPLLYCRQLLLDGNEFFERDGTLVINITSPEISTPYYYHVASNKARVCVKQFLRHPKNTGAKSRSGHAVLAMLIILGHALLF